MVPRRHIFDWSTRCHSVQVRPSLLPFGMIPFLFHSFNPYRVPHTVVVLLHHSTSSLDATLLIGWRAFARPRSAPPSSLSGQSPSSLSYLPIITPPTGYRLTPPHHVVPRRHVFDWLTLRRLTQVHLSLLPFGTFPFLFHSLNPQRVPHMVVALLSQGSAIISPWVMVHAA